MITSCAINKLPDSLTLHLDNIVNPVVNFTGLSKVMDIANTVSSQISVIHVIL